MKILTPGHRYALANFENPIVGQVVQFIEKEPVEAGNFALKTVNDGTTNEEVLAMLIDRMGFLIAKVPSRESAIALTKLQEAKMWLEIRTVARKVRGVEGTNAP
jgi:hypothetical protein